MGEKGGNDGIFIAENCSQCKGAHGAPLHWLMASLTTVQTASKACKGEPYIIDLV